MYIGGSLGAGNYPDNNGVTNGFGSPSVQTPGPATFPPYPDYYNYGSSNGSGVAQSIPVPLVNGVRATTFDFAVSRTLSGQAQWVVDGGTNPQMTITSTYVVKPDDATPTPTPTPPPAYKIPPPWAPERCCTICPDCGGMTPGDGGCGASAGDPVDLASGQESYEPAADLMSYNANGLNAAYQRNFSTQQSLNGYSTPGLARGWVSNSDVYVTGSATAWGVLTLHYPNGSTETMMPQLNTSGQPTGNFLVNPGAPYIVTGVPGSTTGSWNSINVAWKQQSYWTFKPLSGAPGTYALDRITNKLGQANSFTWDATRRLQTVKDVSSGATLLTLAYNASGYLSTVTDAYGRQIAYTFGTPTSYVGTELMQVSQIVAAGTASPPMRTSYDYTNFPNGSNISPLMSSISVPNPTGTGLATARMTYDNLARVVSNIDGNGNIRTYAYYGLYTVVQSKDPQGNVVLSYTQNFDAQGRKTGTTDAAGKSDTISYTDANNPYSATWSSPFKVES